VTDARDRYLPVRKDDILSALAQQRASADPAGSKKFRRCLTYKQESNDISAC
jgi:hypothetical protein